MTHYEVQCSTCGGSTLIVRGHNLDEVAGIMLNHERSHGKEVQEIDVLKDVLKRTSEIVSLSPYTDQQLKEMLEKLKKEQELLTHTA